MFTKLNQTYRKFPKSFWVLIFATFIDHLGGALMFPFFAIYITLHFKVGMTEVGLMFTLFGIGAFFGNFLGGALTDKYGRRKLFLFGLIASALSSISMGLIDNINLFYAIAPLVGLLGRIGGPAVQAMLVDLLPEKTRPEGFAIYRVADNLAVTIGPAIGGLLASHSYMFLFVGDAIASAITAVIVILVISESKPQPAKDGPVETIGQTMEGYKEVLRDWIFMLFITISALGSLVYMQMNSTLSVYLLQEHGFSAQNFGLLLSMNAFMVVVFQFPISRRISKNVPLKMISIGMAFYAVGFAMYGFISSVFMIFMAMVIITIGEMIVATFSQSMAASFASEDKRGRYMAMHNYAHILPSMFGVLAVGLFMDNMDSFWVWYIGGFICTFAALAYLLLLRLMNGKRENIDEYENRLSLDSVENT